MSDSATQEYLELFGGDRQTWLALLACSAALRLDDETAHAAVELIAQSNGSTSGLVWRVKNLGCVWKEWNGLWHVTDDVRPYLLDRLHEEVPEATLSSLRERLAASAEARAELLPRDGQVTTHDRLLSRFEAAYQRVLIPEKSEEGAALLAEIWQHAPPDAAQATARSVDYLADELTRRLRRLPDEILFLRGMAARSRGDRKTQEEYFRQVWERGRRGYIYAVAAHEYGLLVKGRDRETAERAIRDSALWDVSDHGRAVAYHSLGKLLAEDRDRRLAAEQAYNQSIKLDDERSSAETWHSLGDLLAKAHDRRLEAEQAYEKSLKLLTTPKHQGQVYHSLGNLLARDPNRWQGAERAYNRSLELAQDTHSRAQRLHSLGKLLIEIPERRQEAEKLLEQSFRLRDNDADKARVLSTWAYALSGLEDAESNERAEKYALQALELAQNNSRTRAVVNRALGRIYERRGDYSNAIEAYKVWGAASEESGEYAIAKDARKKIDELSRKVRQQEASKGKKPKKKWWEFED